MIECHFDMIKVISSSLIISKLNKKAGVGDSNCIYSSVIIQREWKRGPWGDQIVYIYYESNSERI